MFYEMRCLFFISCQSKWDNFKSIAYRNPSTHSHSVSLTSDLRVVHYKTFALKLLTTKGNAKIKKKQKKKQKNLIQIQR